MSALTFALWLFLVWSLGWLFFPLSRRIFAPVLPDAGLSVGRVLALGLWTLGAFWLGNAGVSTQSNAFGWIVIAAFGIGLAVRERAALQTEIRTRKRAIFASEAVFLLVFLVFFVLRGFWSDTAGTNGEKGMDAALIGSFARAEKWPPPNPYSAGAELRGYYGFGHLQAALLTEAVGTTTRWSYNLMCATLPALCFSTLFSLGVALCGRLRFGFIIAGAVLGLGTLQPILQWLYPANFGPSTPFKLDHFATSRILPYAINEYPWFTFNQSDLHAHYFALPFALASVCLAYALFRGQRTAFVPAILVLGVQILTNTWDFPAYALLMILALHYASFWNSRLQFSRRALAVGALVLGAILVAAPYLMALKTGAQPPQRLPFPASPLREWLLLWGPFGAVWLGFLSYFLFQSRWQRAACLGLCLFVFALAYRSSWFAPPPTPFLASPLVLPLITILLALSLWGALQLRESPRFLCFLAIAGLVALAWSETTWAGFLGSPQNLGFEDYKRQDTVFKFGMQTWMLWGIAVSSGACLAWHRWPEILKCALIAALPVMLIASIAATFGRARNFSQWDGWDGWAHLAPSEKEAANWLLERTPRGQNILEAEQKDGGDYSPFSRYTHATGIPTVIGPQAHSFQWSPADLGQAKRDWNEILRRKTPKEREDDFHRKVGREWEEVMRRKAQARAFYMGNDVAATRAILNRYGVRYIVWGELEQTEYGDAALENLRLNFPRVAEFGGQTNPNRVWIFENRTLE
jgi:YYY domain-containing protein